MTSLDIIKVVDKLNACVIINLDELKNSERLEGAHILKTLFNVNEHTNFSQDFEMRKNEEGKFTILQDYDLSKNQWLEFINYIRRGRIQYMEDMSANKDKLFNHINDLYSGVFGVFGPIPSFDLLCENIINECKKKEKEIEKRERRRKKRNPMTPKEDIDQKFYWTSSILSYPTSSNAEFPDDTIWCVTQPFESGNMCEKYYRSKK